MRRVIVSLILLALVSLGAMPAFAAAPRAIPYPGIPAADHTAVMARSFQATPASVTAAFTDPVAAALAIGNRLVDIQADVTSDNAGNGADPGDSDADDGGWDWVVTGATQHPAGKSYENLYGPIARGLAEAAIFTGSARLGTGTGDVFAGISQAGTGVLGRKYYGIYDADIVKAYLRWGAHSGNAALKDSAKDRHDDTMADFAAANPGMNGAAVRARIIRNGRVGGGQGGLWPWDIHLLSNDCDALKAAFPGSAATYNTELDSIAQVVLDDKNGLLGTPGNWDPTNFLQDWHQTAAAGALRVFDMSPRVDDNALATAMRDTLVNGQLPNGAWGVSYGGTFYADDAQTTAYAVLALAEYAKNHNDATAMHRAFLGRQWLLALVPANGQVNDGGGEYSETDGEVIQALLTGDEVKPVPPSTCIDLTNTCVAVPVNFTRVDNVPVRGYSVTLTLSANLSLCGAGIVQGTYLSGVGGTNYQVLNLGGGVYTVDCATLGVPCGATGSGTLFTLNLASSSPSGIGTVTVNSVIARDCSNAPVSAIPGPPATITIDNTAPVNITNLAAAQDKTSNDADGTTKVDLTFTPPGDAATVLVYRKGYGAYPEYDDAGGSVPGLPGSYPPAGWTLAATLPGTATTHADEVAWPNRDFWYYVAYVKDACGNVSAVSNLTGGTLNYHLGDVTPAPGAGDNLVGTIDITLLGANYGITLIPADPFNYLDVGPTTDYSVDARPTTDNKVNFEDLMMFAINYGTVSAPQVALVPAGRDELALEAPAQVAEGESFAVTIRMQGSGTLQGLSLELGWDVAVAEPVVVEAGGLLSSQDGVVLSARPGNVDVALLGVRGRGLSGEGVLATVTFRAKAAGAPNVVLRSVDARDAANRRLELAASRPAPPVATGLAAATPNPFRGTVSLAFGVAKAGPVELAIYSVDGRRVKVLASGVRGAGEYRLTWDATDDGGNALNPGVFFLRLTTSEGRFTRAISLVR